jgi:hypothetical protein
MPATTSEAVKPVVPLRSPILISLVAWLIPGAGHFLLGRKGRAAILFCAVVAAFLIGVAMKGPFFAPAVNGDILSKLIQYGGIAGDIANGLLYFVASFAGWLRTAGWAGTRGRLRLEVHRLRRVAEHTRDCGRIRDRHS